MKKGTAKTREHQMFDELYDFFDIATIKNDAIDETNMKSRIRKRIHIVREDLKIGKHQWSNLLPSEKEAFINALLNDKYFLNALDVIHDSSASVDELAIYYKAKALDLYNEGATANYLPIFYENVRGYQDFVDLLKLFNNCYKSDFPIPAISEKAYSMIPGSISICDYAIEYETTWYEIYNKIEHSTNIDEFSYFEIEVHDLVANAIDTIDNSNIDREINQVLASLFDVFFGIRINTERIKEDILFSKATGNHSYRMSPAQIVDRYCEDSPHTETPDLSIEEFDNINEAIDKITNDLTNIKRVLKLPLK